MVFEVQIPWYFEHGLLAMNDKTFTCGTFPSLQCIMEIVFDELNFLGMAYAYRR